MGLEIERKFLVKQGSEYSMMASGSVDIVQGYLSERIDAIVRVRVYGNQAFLTVKSRNCGAVRREWEYAVPVNDALDMLALPGVRKLSKTRYFVPISGVTWEVDVFHGRLEGLVIAEVEVEHPEQQLILPDFIGEEVTHDPRYFNSSLIGDEEKPPVL